MCSGLDLSQILFQQNLGPPRLGPAPIRYDPTLIIIIIIITVGAMNELVGASSISHKVKGYCYLLVFVLVMIFYYVVILSRG